MKKNKKKKILVVIITLLLIFILFTFRAFLMPIRLMYCQGLVLRYIPYYFDEIKLNRIEKDDLSGLGKEYRDIDLIRINFSIPHLEYYNKVNESIYELWIETKGYIEKNKDSELHKKRIRLSISDHGRVTCLRNYDTTDAKLLDDKWVYCEGVFDSWKDVDLFSDLYGIECYIEDVTDTEDIEPYKWKNLSFIHVRTRMDFQGKQALYDELTDIFPNIEITID